MKILVTGGAGFLGQAIIQRLLAHGHQDIRVLVRSSAQMELFERPIECVQGNLVNPADAVRAVVDVDVVIHAAAAMNGPTADIFLNSVVASRNLLEALKGKSTKVVLVSSFGVYGPTQRPRGALLDETMPLETAPEKRDPYSHAKLRQEQLFREYAAREGFPLVILRPGSIYGKNAAIPGRVGLRLPGVFADLGGRNPLPLTHVENCAEAVVVAAMSDAAVGQVFNVVDDHVPTCSEFLSLYKNQRSVRVPYFMTWLLSHAVERYHIYSQGQLPAFITPYKVRAMWGGNRFSNARLKSLGWQPVRKESPRDLLSAA